MTTPEVQRVIDAAKAWKRWCDLSPFLFTPETQELYDAVEALPDEDVAIGAKAIADLSPGHAADDWRDEAEAVVRALQDAGRLK